MLIKNGADVNKADKLGLTPIFFAAINSKNSKTNVWFSVKMLQFFPLNLFKSGNEKVIETLIKNGANVNIATRDKVTPLSRAIINSRFIFVRKLLINYHYINYQLILNPIVYS